jgi:predicted dehydrogenase
VPSTVRIRAAVVGTGAIVTGSHLPALRAFSDRVDLVAVVDVVRTSSKCSARRPGKP